MTMLNLQNFVHPLQLIRRVYMNYIYMDLNHKKPPIKKIMYMFFL